MLINVSVYRPLSAPSQSLHYSLTSFALCCLVDIPAEDARRILEQKAAIKSLPELREEVKKTNVDGGC